MKDLDITINGQAFDHMLNHFVLCWSNWETASVCFSESYESLSTCLQNALWKLGSSVGFPNTIGQTTSAVPSTRSAIQRFLPTTIGGWPIIIVSKAVKFSPAVHMKTAMLSNVINDAKALLSQGYRQDTITMSAQICTGFRFFADIAKKSF